MALSCWNCSLCRLADIEPNLNHSRPIVPAHRTWRSNETCSIRLICNILYFGLQPEKKSHDFPPFFFLWTRNLASQPEEITQTAAFEYMLLRGISEVDTCPKLFSGGTGIKPYLNTRWLNWGFRMSLPVQADKSRIVFFLMGWGRFFFHVVFFRF